MKCGACEHIRIVEDQPYHDCREGSPSVVVSGFKPSQQSKEATVGKIMTVWPRVALAETGCSRFKPKTTP